MLTLRVCEEVVTRSASTAASRELTRLLSRFAMVRSDDDRLDALTRRRALGRRRDDPKSMARWMRKMGKELGEDGGEDFDEMVDELERGPAPTRTADADGGDEL